MSPKAHTPLCLVQTLADTIACETKVGPFRSERRQVLAYLSQEHLQREHFQWGFLVDSAIILNVGLNVLVLNC